MMNDMGGGEEEGRFFFVCEDVYTWLYGNVQ